jgi:hypothetical protein
MSLINDALKRARQAPPRDPQNPFPNLPPAAAQPTSAAVWLIPTLVIFLIVAAVFFIGWAMAHHSVESVAKLTPAAVAAVTPADAESSKPVTKSPAVTTTVVAPVITAPPPEPAPVLNPPDAPKLQGIFYSPTAPAAIMDGKTVRPGDFFLRYRVAEITQFSVVLTGTNGKSIKLTISN